MGGEGTGTRVLKALACCFCCFPLCGVDWLLLQDPTTITAQTRQEQPRMGALRLQVVRFLETLVGMDNPAVDQVLIQEVSGPFVVESLSKYFRFGGCCFDVYSCTTVHAFCDTFFSCTSEVCILPAIAHRCFEILPRNRSSWRVPRKVQHTLVVSPLHRPSPFNVPDGILWFVFVVVHPSVPSFPFSLSPPCAVAWVPFAPTYVSGRTKPSGRIVTLRSLATNTGQVRAEGIEDARVLCHS